MTYQKVTGPLMASGYNKLGTQEAINDMYIVSKYWDGGETTGTLTANNAGGGQRMPDKDNFNAVIERRHEKVGELMANVVRRLTPLECERLQGYPDGWTDIGEYTDTSGKTRQTSDSARYKALGNSIALPFWAYLMRRISAQYERPATMGSLFDGISGFPLCALRAGMKPAWSSEIEEFAIAVCKRHFGDEETGERGDVGEYL